MFPNLVWNMPFVCAAVQGSAQVLNKTFSFLMSAKLLFPKLGTGLVSSPAY